MFYLHQKTEGLALATQRQEHMKESFIFKALNVFLSLVIIWSVSVCAANTDKNNQKRCFGSHPSCENILSSLFLCILANAALFLQGNHFSFTFFILVTDNRSTFFCVSSIKTLAAHLWLCSRLKLLFTRGTDGDGVLVFIGNLWFQMITFTSNFVIIICTPASMNYVFVLFWTTLSTAK